MSAAVKLMAEAADTFTVGGYGVVWGGRDIAGDRFEKDTDLWDDRLLGTPILYHHGQDPIVGLERLGAIITKTSDDTGLWVEAQLQKSAKYTDAVMELVRKGVLGWSAGSAPHVATTPGTGKLASWPWIELSLTPTPCEPRTLGVEEVTAIKAVLDSEKAAGLPSSPSPAALPTKALPPSTPVDGAGSYERLACDIQRAYVAWLLGQGLLDPAYGEDYGWRCHVAQTYSEYAIVNYWDGHDYETAQVGYTVAADGSVTITEAREVESVYQPVGSLDLQTAPLAMMATTLTTHIGTLTVRTKDVLERRTKEGRVLSTGNRGRLAATAEAMRAALSELDDLLAATEPQPAKAASVDQDLSFRLALLKLAA